MEDGLTNCVATVVFSATVIARMVKDDFRKRARTSGPYRDVQVGFSHDPCERALNLITQMPATRPIIRPREGCSGSDISKRPAVPLNQRRRPSSSLVDEDGWQTVARRK